MPEMIVRAALTQTVNAYAGMPASRAELSRLKGRLDDIRQANVAHHLDLMRIAKAEGVRVIGFGELFPASYFALSPDPRLVIADPDLSELAGPDPSGWNLARDIRHEIYSPRQPRG